jgi:membrane-bound metal-dependent hydrolase YbcI (DUF457 family)
MPTPYGHVVVAYTVARELGLPAESSRFVALLATLPDIDMPVGLLFKRDLFAFHRRATHSFPFALVAGAGTYALYRRVFPGREPREALVAGVLTNFGVVTHVIADMVDWPYLNRVEQLTHSRVFRNLGSTVFWEALNIGIETALFTLPALLLARDRRRRELRKGTPVVP